MAMIQGGEPGGEELRRMFGPGAVDEALRQAIKMCWMMLPEGRRTMDDVEREVRRLLDRVLKDWREDARSFGIG